MFSAVGPGNGDVDISRWFGIKNNGERGSGTCFCGEEIAGAVGGAGLGNGDAGGLVIGCFECCGGCFSAGVATCVGSGGGECGGCLLYTSPSPRDGLLSRMPSSA